MIKPISLLLFLFVAALGISQSTDDREQMREQMEEMFKVKVSIDLPADLFEETGMMNGYVNKEDQAMVSLMRAPRGLDLLSERKALPDEKDKTIDIGGKEALILEDAVKEDGSTGQKFVTKVYAIADTEETSIMVTCLYPQEKADVYEQTIFDALKSVRIK